MLGNILVWLTVENFGRSEMKKWLGFLLLVVLLAGCSSGRFQVSENDYKQKVQVLGVLPLLVDRNSSLNYPEKDLLFDVLAQSAEGKHHQLAERLKEKKNYFDVRLLSNNSELTALSLLAGGSTHDDLGWPLGYNFDKATIAEIAKKNVVDALLIVVFSGEQVEMTRYSRTKLEKLTTRYSDILATAAVVDRNGEVLWQLADQDSFEALVLQYPDFDEAYYNKTDLVRVKNITLSGIERVLDEDSDKNGINELPEMYDNLFDEIVSGIGFDMIWPFQ
jgi:hypothetical protein